MAVTYVPCKHRQHAIDCREMDLLYINFGWGWELAMGLNAGWVADMYGRSTGDRWPRVEDFGIAVED